MNFSKSKPPIMRNQSTVAGVLLGASFALCAYLWRITLPWAFPSAQQAIAPTICLLGWTAIGLVYSFKTPNIKQSFALLAHLGLAASIVAASILLDANRGVDLRIWSRQGFSVLAIGTITWLLLVLGLAVPGFLFGVSAALVSRIESNSQRQRVIFPPALVIGFAIGTILWKSLQKSLSLDFIPFIAIGPALASGLLIYGAWAREIRIEQAPTPSPKRFTPLIEVIIGSTLMAAMLLLWLGFLTQSIWIHPDINPTLLVLLGLAVGMVWLKPTRDLRLLVVLGFASTSIFLVLLYLWQPIATALGPISRSQQRPALLDLSFLTVVLFCPSFVVGSFIATLANKSRNESFDLANLPALIIGVAIAIIIVRGLPTNNLRYQVILRTLPFGFLALLAREIYQNRKTSFATGITPLLVVLAVILAIKAPKWDNLLAAGSSKFGSYQPGKGVSIDGLMPFYQESPDGISAVLREEHKIYLTFGGKIRVAMPDHLALKLISGHLALAFSRHMGKVLIIGDPGLVLSGAVASHRVEKIVCLDPQADMASCGQWFRHYCQDVLTDKRLIVTSTVPYEKFEAILVDGLSAPLFFNPDTSPLNSAIGFAEALNFLLADDGVLVYAIAFEGISGDHLLLMISALRSIFPQISIWLVEPIGISVVASKKPMIIDAKKLEEKTLGTESAKSLRTVGISDPIEVLAFRALDQADILELTAGIPRITTENASVFWQKYSRNQTNRLEIMRMILSNSQQEKELLPLKSRQRFLDGVALVEQGKHMAATKLLDELCNQTYPNGYYRYFLSNYLVGIARDLRTNNRKREALSASRMAIGCFDTNPIAYYEAALSEEDNPVAIKLLDKAITLNPDYYHAYVAKAKIELSAGDPHSAIETLGEIVTTEPLNGEVGYLRAMALIASNQISSARMLLQQIVRRGSQSDEVMEAFAYTLLLEGKLEKALDLYRDLVKSKPRDIGLLNNYATLLAEKGKLKDAIKIWKQALSLDPQNNDIKANIEEAEAKLKR